MPKAGTSIELHFFSSFQVFYSVLCAAKYLNAFASYTWSSFPVVSSQAVVTSSGLTDVHQQISKPSNHSEFLTRTTFPDLSRPSSSFSSFVLPDGSLSSVLP